MSLMKVLTETLKILLANVFKHSAVNISRRSVSMWNAILLCLNQSRVALNTHTHFGGIQCLPLQMPTFYCCRCCFTYKILSLHPCHTIPCADAIGVCVCCFCSFTFSLSFNATKYIQIEFSPRDSHSKCRNTFWMCLKF